MSAEEQEVSGYPQQVCLGADLDVLLEYLWVLRANGFNAQMTVSVWVKSRDEHRRMLALLTCLSEERKKAESRG